MQRSGQPPPPTPPPQPCFKCCTLTSRSCTDHSSNTCCSSHAGCTRCEMTSDTAPGGGSKVRRSWIQSSRTWSKAGGGEGDARAWQTHWRKWLFFFFVNWKKEKVLLTSDSVSLEWYSQRPAYRGLRSCRGIKSQVRCCCQQFTIKSENCPTSSLRCARMSLCCISTVAQKGQAGLYLLNLWDATKSYMRGLLVKCFMLFCRGAIFFLINICFKIPKLCHYFRPNTLQYRRRWRSTHRGGHSEPSWPLVMGSHPFTISHVRSPQ